MPAPTGAKRAECPARRARATSAIATRPPLLKPQPRAIPHSVRLLVFQCMKGYRSKGKPIRHQALDVPIGQQDVMRDTRQQIGIEWMLGVRIVPDRDAL